MPEDTSTESAGYLQALFNRAFERNSFDALCALLRVGGMSDQDWDPLDESRRAFDDMTWLLDQLHGKRDENSVRRVQLFAYCHAVEMSACHDLLHNLVSIATGKNYHIAPFRHLARRKKNSIRWTPPSAKKKMSELCNVANAQSEPALSRFLASFFCDEVRNAFVHSDYIFTDSGFRWTEGGVPTELPKSELDLMILNCFAFYRALLNHHSRALHDLTKARRFHPWPNYEVLEILSSPTEGVYGFSVHFSNGSKATFARRASGVTAENLRFTLDGGVTFMRGLIDELEPVHKVNGVRVTDWDALERGDA